MPRRLTAAESYQDDNTSEEPFRIMVVYDDMSAGLGAQHYLDSIADRIGGGSALDVRFWKHDILAEPHLWRQASADAAEVDLILFSMSTSLVLPTRIMRWVQKWNASLAGQEVSFAVLSAPECENHSLVKMAQRFLKQTARFHETQFFKGVLPGNLCDGSVSRRSSTPGATGSSPATRPRRGQCRTGQPDAASR